MTNPINPSEPLTYEILNNIIQDINLLRSDFDNNQNLNNKYPLIDVVINSTNVNRTGAGNVGSPIQITAASELINENGTTINKTIPYKEKFNSKPIVVCTLELGRYKDVSPTVVIQEVNNTNFNVKIKLDTRPEDMGSIILNYIAIGYDKR